VCNFAFPERSGKPKSLRLLGREEEAARVEAVMG